MSAYRRAVPAVPPRCWNSSSRATRTLLPARGGMFALFQRYAAAGRQKLPTAVFHEADRGSGVWQFIKGRLRVFCFIDDGAMVVLTHGMVKKTQKAD